jgi:hypothetical protein
VVGLQSVNRSLGARDMPGDVVSCVYDVVVRVGSWPFVAEPRAGVHPKPRTTAIAPTAMAVSRIFDPMTALLHW